MTRCLPNEQELLYAEGKMNDILNLKRDFVLPGGVTIQDVFRFFKGASSPVRR